MEVGQGPTGGCSAIEKKNRGYRNFHPIIADSKRMDLWFRLDFRLAPRIVRNTSKVL
jgi:hypothetical protein